MAKKNNHSHPHTVLIKDFIEELEFRIPTDCSESWDNVGLICGDQKTPLKGIVIGVDLTESLINLALKKKANLIILHHPPLFPKGRGLSRLTLGKTNALNTLLLNAFQNKIAIYVAHTNFDRCALDGMYQLARDLGTEPMARIINTPEDGTTLFKKLVTYIPIDHFEAVRDALYEVGCGHIGNYDSCGFSTAGVGNFKPLLGADPAIGKKPNKNQPTTMESVEEIRFETIIVSGMEKIILDTLKHHHPYEEVAYDLYPVEQAAPKVGMVWGLGYGFIAAFKKPIPYALFVKKVKSTFKIKSILTNYATPKSIKKIAFSPGKGSSFISAVQAHQVDVFITGEVGYHDSTQAERQGLNIMELGHRESEHYFLKTFHSWCREWNLPHHVLDERTQKTI